MTKSQLQMWQEAEQRAFRVNEMFVYLRQHIDNPLTDAELEMLTKKRPELWGRFLHARRTRRP